jgi:hypothetical protein
MKSVIKAYKYAFAAVVLGLALWSAHAQFRGGGRFRQEYQIRDPELIRQQEMMQKDLNPEFRGDVFTFARLKFKYDQGSRFGGGRLWDDDAPEADLNLIFRLFVVTSLKVQPGLNIIDITTKELADHPFVYIASAGRMVLADEEAAALRKYLLNGGFIMADDFWGDDQWTHFFQQIKRVFPEREPVELTIDHRIFHTVFDFKKHPQIPSVGSYLRSGESYDSGWPYVRHDWGPHYYGMFDDKQRMMMLICHNNHYGDGWEHEGDDQTYFDRFSEPMGYPMLINILVYTMSH